jgi:hypothetical protein
MMGTGLLCVFAVLLALGGITAFAGTSGPVPIPPAPNFQINTTTLILCKGLTNNIPIKISDLGNAYNPAMTSVELSLSGTGLSDVGPSIDISNISSYNSLTINLPVFVNVNTPTGLMVVQVPINYNYLIYYSDSEVKTLTFEVQTCPSPLEVNASPDLFYTGQIDNITFNFTNTGSTVLSGISAQTTSQNSQGRGVQLFGEQPLVINSLAPGSTVSLEQKLYNENVSQQTFPVNVTVNFFNGTSPEQLSKSFTMFSTGTIDMVPTSITVSPANVVAGSILSISFVITDTGTAGVSDATATAILPKEFTAYGSNSIFLGSIQTGIQTPVSITMIANAVVKSGNYIIPVLITYQNNLAQNLNTTVDVPVVVGGSMSGNFLGGGVYTSNSAFRAEYARRGGGYGLYIEVILLIALIAVSVLYIRLRRKTTKAAPSKSK